MTSRYLLFVLLISSLSIASAWALAEQQEYEFSQGQWVKTVTPARGTPAGELALIRRQLEDQDNSGVISSAKEFLKHYPDDPGCEEVMMLAGQAELNREHYFQAYEWYKKQWDQFPAGTYSDRLLQKEYEIADAFLHGKKRIIAGILYLPARDDGQQILNKIAEQAPGSQIAEKAMERLADDHRTHGEYAEAAATYDRCMELFPKSDHNREHMLQAAQTTHQSYHGVDYDPTPLIEAQQRYKTFAQQYPQSAIKADVKGTLDTLRTQQGQEQWNTAQFYERTHQPQAAGYYYRLIARDYSDTPLAAQAQQALTRLGPQGVRPPRPQAATSPSRAAPHKTVLPPPTATSKPASPAAGEPGKPPVEKKKPVDSEPTELEKLIPATQEGKAEEE